MMKIFGLESLATFGHSMNQGKIFIHFPSFFSPSPLETFWASALLETIYNKQSSRISCRWCPREEEKTDLWATTIGSAASFDRVVPTKPQTPTNLKSSHLCPPNINSSPALSPNYKLQHSFSVLNLKHPPALLYNLPAIKLPHDIKVVFGRKT